MSKVKINIWKEFAEMTNGKFLEGKSWHSDRAEVDYQNLKIVFDNFTLWSGKFSTEMTRIIVPYISNDNFRFEIYRNSFTRTVEKLLGAQDIEIGREDFDKDFVIKSNNEFKIKKMLHNPKIRNYIKNLKDVNIQTSDQDGIWENKLPEKELQLSFFADGEINDFEVLKSLLHLFEEMLYELSQMKSISEN